MTEELGCEVIATDSSAAMTATSLAQGVRSILADARFLPFIGAGFDAVVAAWMLYHVSPLDQASREIGRVLRPGGRLVAITNGRKHLAELWSAVETEPSEPAFSGENGSSLLRTLFANVQQHDVSTRAIFENKATAAAYLSSVDRADLVEDLPDSGWPLSANGASAVLVADTAR
jgi:ubiquinone/menaquinone biosynthesis C-methylase UbiE